MQVNLFSKRRIVALVFPANCIGCRLEIEPIPSEAPDQPPSGDDSMLFLKWQQTHWCDDCWSELVDRTLPRCLRCGAVLVLTNPFQDHCRLCHGHDLRFKRAIAVGNYQGLLQELIIRMKGRQDEALAVQLGRLLSFELMAAGMNDFDHVVAIPTYWLRKLKRGFQAADIMSESVSELTGMARFPGLLKTIRATKKQGTLSTQGRFANVRGAFAVLPKAKLAGKRILLIDDVMTSGATSSEAARVLLRHGAEEVSVAVVARGARAN